MNFRDLRNIEAAFFIPAWFVLPYLTEVLKVGGIASLGAILRRKEAKKTKGQLLIDHLS